MDNMNIPQQNNNETVDITKQPINNDNQQQVNMNYQGQANMGYQYQQQPNMIYQQPMKTEYVDEHEANMLAGVSLACIIGSRIMIIISTIVNGLITSEESIITVLLNLFSGLTGIISLAVIVFTVACIAAGVAFIEACGNCPG